MLKRTYADRSVISKNLTILRALTSAVSGQSLRDPSKKRQSCVTLIWVDPGSPADDGACAPVASFSYVAQTCWPYCSCADPDASQMELRKLLCHPYLVDGALEPAGVPPAETQKNLIEASAKLILLNKLLPALQAGGHRTLLVSEGPLVRLARPLTS